MASLKLKDTYDLTNKVRVSTFAVLCSRCGLSLEQIQNYKPSQATRHLPNYTNEEKKTNGDRNNNTPSKSAQ